jgi:uncharacterized protein (DUF1778 family)
MAVDQAENGRVELRLRPGDKAMLQRAAASQRLDLTNFILTTMLPLASALLEREEHLVLSERDSLRVLDLLENPPPAPDRLVQAVEANAAFK